MGNQAAIYTRVSKDASADARSVREQLTECRKVCERNGWDVVGVWEDNDRGASRYSKGERPQWEDLSQRLIEGGIDYLVVWEISRTTRDRQVWAQLVDRCQTAKVRLCVDGRVHDLSNPDEAFNLDLQALLGVREAEVARKRIKRALDANADAGKPHGPVLYGYRREYDATSKAFLRQVPDDVEAPIVLEVVERVLNGEGVNRIAKDLTARGVPTAQGKPWVASSVTRMVKRASYAGKRVHRGEIVGDGNWPALIDLETHYRLVAMLDDPNRRTQFDNRARWLLSGIATCGVCHGRTRVLVNNLGVARYTCVASHVSRKVEPVDAWVVDHVIARLSRPESAELLQPIETQPDHSAARQEADELQARLNSFYSAAAAGDISPAALAVIEKDLQPRIDAARQRSTVPLSSPMLEKFRDVSDEDTAREIWTAMAVTDRRELLRLLLRVEILPSKSSHRFNEDTVTVTFITDEGSS